MSKQTGRKAIIILSDGGDRGSRETLVKSIEAAQRADTIIYAIYFKGEQPHQDYPHNRGGGGYPGGGGGGYPGGGYPAAADIPGGGYPGGGYPGGGNGGGNNGGNYPTGQGHIDGKKNLERMAQETGGRFFEVKKNQNVAQIYTRSPKSCAPNTASATPPPRTPPPAATTGSSSPSTKKASSSRPATATTPESSSGGRLALPLVLVVAFPLRHTSKTVISTEAAHSLIVSGAVEKSASTADLSQPTRLAVRHGSNSSINNIVLRRAPIFMHHHQGRPSTMMRRSRSSR